MNCQLRLNFLVAAGYPCCIQVTARQCNHFIFEGMQAVGKRSMVLALLRDAFGPDDLKIEERPKRIELKVCAATCIHFLIH